MRFVDSYRFLSSGLDNLVKALNENDLIILKKEFPDNWQLLSKKLAYPYEYFKSIEDYELPISNLNKRRLFQSIEK